MGELDSQLSYQVLVCKYTNAPCDTYYVMKVMELNHPMTLVRRVEELGTGAAYCQLLHLLFPGETWPSNLVKYELFGFFQPYNVIRLQGRFQSRE